MVLITTQSSSCQLPAQSDPGPLLQCQQPRQGGTAPAARLGEHWAMWPPPPPPQGSSAASPDPPGSGPGRAGAALPLHPRPNRPPARGAPAHRSAHTSDPYRFILESYRSWEGRGGQTFTRKGGGGGGGVSDPDIKLPGIKLARKTNCFVSGESAQVLHVARAGSNTQLEQDRALAPGTLARALAPPCMAHAPSAHAPSAHTDRHAHAPAWDVASVWSLVEVPTAWWPQQGPSIRVARGPASAQHLPAHSSLAAVRGVSPSPQDGPPTRPGKRSSGSSLHGSPCTWGSVV